MPATQQNVKQSNKTQGLRHHFNGVKYDENRFCTSVACFTLTNAQHRALAYNIVLTASTRKRVCQYCYTDTIFYADMRVGSERRKKYCSLFPFFFIMAYIIDV